MIRVLDVSTHIELTRIMHEIRVDPYGIRIMQPKGITHVVRINALSNITANILKQEMLSLGADAAVARGSLTGETKTTDCLLMGSMAQFGSLEQKLARQPFGLGSLSRELALALKHYHTRDFILRLGRGRLALGSRPRVMGIVNATPDSFSGDGLIGRHQTLDLGLAVAYVQRLVREGADIIDIGGESSRPGAQRVGVREEKARTLPLIKALAKTIKVPVSIDTCKPLVAEAALDSGAVIVNDITGLRAAAMRKVAARYKAAVVLMHMQGTPETMQRHPVYGDCIEEIAGFFARRLDEVSQAGIAADKVIIDPGIGFGKTVAHNCEILRHLNEFKVFGRPLMVGVSRKSFIGRLLNIPEPRERTAGTIAACIVAVENGARILRVHEVKEVRQALKLAEEIARV